MTVPGLQFFRCFPQGFLFIGQGFVQHPGQKRVQRLADLAALKAQCHQIPAADCQILYRQAGAFSQDLLQKRRDLLKTGGFSRDAFAAEIRLLQHEQLPQRFLSVLAQPAAQQLPVRADEPRIAEVLFNLLDNAVKFSPKGSAIRLKTAVRHGRCYVSVKDEGCGIRSEDLPRVWDRFYKTDASRGMDKTGIGLGLPIVKEILNAHGQKISIVSTVHVGTEVVFTLDLA